MNYSWDDSLPEDQITHSIVSIEKCNIHQNVTGADTNAFNAVRTENQRKNQSFDEILQNAPSTNWYDIDVQTGSRKLKSNITFRWTWNGTAPNRILTIFFDGISLTTQQRTQLQTRLNNRFGSGIVTIG
jgi:hypothetical protein